MVSSMEIFAFHPGLNKWVEIGNSGMFRPEMLLPMVRIFLPFSSKTRWSRQYLSRVCQKMCE